MMDMDEMNLDESVDGHVQRDWKHVAEQNKEREKRGETDEVDIVGAEPIS